MGKPIFDNGIDIRTLDGIKRGFLLALVDDAENSFKEWDKTRIKLEELSEQDYKELRGHRFCIRNINVGTVKKCYAIIDEFIASLTEDKQQYLRGLDEAMSTDFGLSLYYAMIYDCGIMGEKFRSDVAKFRPIHETGGIGESVNGDIRVFFD